MRTRRRMWSGLECALAAAALVGLMSGAACQNADFMTHPCGLRFRIATHTIAPFIMLDKAKCTNQRCPPEAFIGEGGLTYEFMMKHLLPKLVQQCKDLNAPDPNVRAALPPSHNISEHRCRRAPGASALRIGPFGWRRTAERNASVRWRSARNGRGRYID